MKRLPLWILLLSLGPLGCSAAIESGSFVDRQANFARYRTYNWGAPGRIEGDPRLEKSSFFRDDFEGEVEKQLAAKGFEGPQERRPDLLIRYRAAVQPQLDVIDSQPSTSNSYGSCSFDCDDRIREYETATLVLDLIDARTQKLVWRGWAREDLRRIIDQQEGKERRIREAVSELMAKLPAHS